MGIFASAGVGKSTLLGMIIKNSKTDAVVLALIGERGREVKEFLENVLGEEGRKKSVIIVTTSEYPLVWTFIHTSAWGTALGISY